MRILLMNIDPWKETFHYYDFFYSYSLKISGMKLDTDLPTNHLISGPSVVNSVLKRDYYIISCDFFKALRRSFSIVVWHCSRNGLWKLAINCECRVSYFLLTKMIVMTETTQGKCSTGEWFISGQKRANLWAKLRSWPIFQAMWKKWR